MSKITPEHFTNRLRFEEYILDCALRDRREYLRSISPDDMSNQIETREEIFAIMERMRRVNQKIANKLLSA